MLAFAPLPSKAAFGAVQDVATLGMLINLQREQLRAEIVDESLWAEVDGPNDLAVARFTFEPTDSGDEHDPTQAGKWRNHLRLR